MNEMETNQISKLLHYIETYYATLKYMKVIIIGIKKKDNSYDAIGVKAEFLPEAAPESEIIFEIPELIVYHSVKPMNIEEIKKFIMDIKNRIILIDNLSFNLEYFNDFGGILLKSHYDYISYFYYRTIWPYYLFEGVGKDKRIKDFINEERLNKSLNKQGYEHLIEVSKEFLDSIIGYDWPFRFYLITPIYILASLEITDKKIIFNLKCHSSININDIEIATNIKKESKKRIKIKFSPNDKISEEGDFIYYQKKEELTTEDKEFFKIWVSYQNEQIDQFSINLLSKRENKIVEVDNKNKSVKFNENRKVFKNISPPIKPKIKELPLKHIIWEDFEYLCFLLSKIEKNLIDQTPYGKKGQSQKGIDIIANIKNSKKKWVCQSKRYKTMTPKKLKGFVDDFLKQDLANKTSVYVFATSVDLSDTKFITTIDTIRKELLEKEIKFISWGSIEINQILKNQYQIVSDCFGDVWAEAFCITIPEIQNDMIQGKILSIGIFSYHNTPKGEEFQFNLDLSSLFKSDNLEANWQMILKKIVKFKTEIQDSSPVKTLLVNPKIHLSAGFIFGYIFRETTGYKLIIKQNNELWSINKTNTSKHWKIREITGNNPNSNNIIIIIRIGTNDIQSPVNTYINENVFQYHQKILYTLNEYIEKDDIYPLIQELIKELKKKIKLHIKFHIFASIPVGLAILIGYHLNVIIPIQLYEYNKSLKTYSPSILIDK